MPFYTARSFISNEPFVVMLGDDVMQDKVPLTKQLMNSYQQTGASTLAVKKVAHKDISKYGVIIHPKKFVQAYLTLKSSLKSRRLKRHRVIWPLSAVIY